jgi:hypothetical protein
MGKRGDLVRPYAEKPGNVAAYEAEWRLLLDERPMFVTMPHFEQFMPPAMVAPDHKYWRAVTMSLENPWYLFVYEADYEGEKVPQTTLVAWESTLMDIVEGIPAANRRAIARIDKDRGAGARWALQWVQSLWAALPSESEETGVMLLKLEGEQQIRNAHLEPVVDAPGRQLLFEAPSKPVNPSPEPEIPDDFPPGASETSVAGAQPKVAVYRDGDTYTDGAAAHRAERYEICKDLLEQLIAYGEKKMSETPSLTRSKLAEQMVAQLEKKRFGWGVSPNESQWIADRVRSHFGARSESA